MSEFDYIGLTWRMRHDAFASCKEARNEVFNYEFYIISSNFNIRFLYISESRVMTNLRLIKRTIYLTYIGNTHKLPRYGSMYTIPLVITVE